MTRNDKIAIELDGILGRACGLLSELDTATTDAESTLLYAMLCQVSNVKTGLTESSLGGVFSQQAVIDARPAIGFAG